MDNKARIWFFTDIHGSNSCFNKFINLINNENKPNVLILGADITGKQIVPLVESINNTFLIPLGGREIRKRLNEKNELIKELSNIGYYPYECSLHEYKQFKSSKSIQKTVFEKLAKERLKEWIKIADNKLPETEYCKVIINGGNDDPLFVDEIIDKSKRLIRPEGQIIDLPANIKLLSTGYSTKTPWECPRDISEDELKMKISDMTDQLVESSRLVFNFHCPPINTSLDLANKLDSKTFRKMHGKIHAGSTSIRTAIEFWQPIASFHGHIHEVHTKEKLGQTLCFNPGTDYLNAKLQGAFIQVNDKGEIEFETLTRELLGDKSEKETDGIIKTIIKNIPWIGGFYKDLTANKKQNEISSGIDELNKKVDQLLNQKIIK